MEVTSLVFLSLLISAGTTGKLISRDEISSSTLLSWFDDGKDLLRKSIQSLQEKSKFITKGEEESFQEEQELEPRLGPHYLTRQNHGEEPPLDMSDTADPLRKNTDQEGYKEDVKVRVMLAVSCTTLICSFMFVSCCFIAFIKYRMKKGIFCDKLRCSQEKNRNNLPLFSHGFWPLPEAEHWGRRSWCELIPTFASVDRSYCVQGRRTGPQIQEASRRNAGSPSVRPRGLLPAALTPS
ncbi:uncharacterized protein LOC133277085 [Pezoporus flaviventris]|uniref:uncharacterized protein LOC133277085 n=1 Tax=Pezoporus flaviventris TaxID=889875 RepID=UPI002AB283D1|nr:uncharacterized protein LOC133277085 [Pezoporus flaviventris]